MTDITKFKAELRDIILDMLLDGEDTTIAYPDGYDLVSWRIIGEHLNRLCDLADLGELGDALTELDHEILLGRKVRR